MKSFGWILILLCTVNFLATYAHQDLLISSEEFSLSNLEKHDSEHARKLTASEVINVAGRGQKGRGAYGGANVVHRRPGNKSAAAELVLMRRPWPCFFILFAIFGFLLS